MATSTPSVVADGPFKLISSAKSGDKKDAPAKGARVMAAEMSIVHNCLIRGINAIYLQAPNVSARGTSKDKLDFANFAWQWCVSLEEHHESEEQLFFPEMEELTGVPGLMDGNVEEHKLFHHGFEDVMAYLGRVKGGEEDLDGDRLRGMIDGFMPTLREHLEREIDTLTALDEYADKCDWPTWFKGKADKMMMEKMSSASFRTDQLPLTMTLHDKTFEGGVWESFPPVPWLLHVALRWLFLNTHKDWWRFAPCDYYSLPQEMPFA
ncbi:hypothetical protein ACRE_019750 [Hapsidospora chrysogenum ATCC 11550]|uniref:Hemerythrin-like domain-containing protein n=1 Tax=Hapsidospora chrysogenum (strain ATCC 11550 / CBS 779.69 / DSM 880 / IAM 14645 / JCM 23072 / IMI 49137) TaxID=857340 RepID=A0A086TCT5_HAPC1|nr:hypothetical protein ACRE_019750 [Hapsidospora chrysogenum ATCC 11550]